MALVAGDIYDQGLNICCCWASILYLQSNAEFISGLFTMYMYVHNISIVRQCI
jgi:hypothetical protein